MIDIKYFFLCLIFISILGCKVNKLPLGPELKSESFNYILDSIYQANPESKGIMVHVEYPDDNVSWTGAIGYSDFINQIPLKADQPVLIASSIKTIVAAAILKMVELGQTDIEHSIENIITERTANLLRKDGYNLDQIKIKHLLSHTSGIEDYISADNVKTYLGFVMSNKQHRWTRDEQIQWTIDLGDPLGEPESIFNYADANYLILTEIIEHYTQKPFYTAIKELIDYKQLNMSSTWFYTLEDPPHKSKPLAHQYYSTLGFDSYDIDPSFDLYGGGGIACTTIDLAKFSYALFNNKIIIDPLVLDLIYTEIKVENSEQTNYFLGLSKGEISGYETFGHGGFWGTIVNYYPKLNCSIAVFILERDKRMLRKNVQEAILKELIKR